MCLYQAGRYDVLHERQCGTRAMERRADHERARSDGSRMTPVADVAGVFV